MSTPRRVDALNAVGTRPIRQAPQQLQRTLVAYTDDLDQTRAANATSMLRAETGPRSDISRSSGAEKPPNEWPSAVELSLQLEYRVTSKWQCRSLARWRQYLNQATRLSTHILLSIQRRAQVTPDCAAAA